MKFRLIERRKLQDAWDAPFDIRFFLAYGIMVIATMFCIFLLVSLILELITGIGEFPFMLIFINPIITVGLTFLLQIAIFNKFHELDYLHYCKTIIIGQIYTVIALPTLISFLYHYWVSFVVK